MVPNRVWQRRRKHAVGPEVFRRINVFDEDAEGPVNKYLIAYCRKVVHCPIPFPYEIRRGNFELIENSLVLFFKRLVVLLELQPRFNEGPADLVC